MKKGIICAMAVTGLFLLAACGPKEGTGPVRIETDDKKATPIVVPTCTPTATPSPVPGLHPTVGPTATATPRLTPTPVPTETPTPSPNPTAVPTVEPTSEPTATPKPTAVPTVEPTATPEPTLAPSPTPTPTSTPTPTPTPSPTPTPTINPEPLVAKGWQKTVSIDNKYNIVFPELFRKSELTKTDNKLLTAFFCENDSEIEFDISYTMQQTKEHIVYDILAAGGSVTEDRPLEKRTTCTWQTGDRIYIDILIDAQYPQSMLGDAFGEDEWIDGVMQVIFSYPAEKREMYETEQYRFFVVGNGEE